MESDAVVQELRERSRRLELEICSGRLLTHLFPEEQVPEERAGRYRPIEDTIERNPDLLSALLAGDHDAVLHTWSACLRDQGTNVRLHHTLAVLYRERALDRGAGASSSGDVLVFATALWALLLCTEAFWEQFGGTEPQLLEKVARELFALHGTLGARELVAGRSDHAQLHLRCLADCRAGAEELTRVLAGFQLPYRHRVDAEKMAKVSALAADVLDSWCGDVIRAAEKQADDPEVIKGLPQGIRKNYEGGIRSLEPFVRLDVPMGRVLRSGLEWYNDWCYCLYTRQEIGRIKELMQSARGVADQLIPLCTTGRGHQPENQALSQHFLLRGFVSGDAAQATLEYEQALAWNPANNNAQDLLEGSVAQLLEQLVETVMERLQHGDFEQAFELLEATGSKVRDQATVHRLRAIACSRHGQALADQGRFKAALKWAREALELAPEEPALQRFAQEMAELAPEERNLKRMHRAQTAMEAGDYGRTIEEAAGVSQDSRFEHDARRLQSAALYSRAVNAAEAGHFEQAADDLRSALPLNSDPRQRRTIQEQLAAVERASERASFDHALHAALEREDWARAEALLRTALAKGPAKAVKKQLASQLSLVLNARAVKLINDAQETERRFGEAMQEILTAVRSRLPGG